MPFDVCLRPGFRKRARRLNDIEFEALADVIERLRVEFGQPHRHGGLGIRRLHSDLFECRLGIRLRVLFFAQPGLLIFVELGNHDDVRRFLKGL
jgi:hypothetical protein